MKILGIHDSHDSGIALLDNNKIVFAINEERLSRIKLCRGFPKRSIEYLIEKYAKPEEVDKVVVGSKYIDFMPDSEDSSKGDLDEINRKALSKFSSFGGFFFKTNLWIPVNEAAFKIILWNRKKKITKVLREYGFKCPIEFVDHHTSHAASAYYTCGKDNVLVFTSDAAGDALSATVSIGKDGKLERIGRVNAYNSLGKLYTYVTEICGFKPVRHEGKITGLAAYGKPTYLDVFNNMVVYKKGGFVNISNSKHDRSKEIIMKKIGENFKREDLAASVQQHLENETIKFMKYWLRKTGLKDVVLAGGVFANVKLNQRILELEEVDSVYIHPNMGDGGLGLGAALYASKNMPISIDEVYFGPDYSEQEIKKALDDKKLKYKRYDNVEKEIAKLIKNGKVVARFNGRMEYGPRALGNRSILYHAGDKTVNDWLNKRLKRCYDEETEVLTNDGWKFMKDVKNNEVVATLNLEKDELEFQKVLDVISYNYEGDMYKIRNNRIDLLVTPEHYMLVKKKHSNKFKREKIDDVFKISTYHYQKKSCGNWRKSKDVMIKKEHMSKIPYIGKAYCVSVPNKIIFVRRNGKSVFSGNSEFMPFAPVSMEEHKDENYLGIKGGEQAAKFMTITFNCSEKMKKECPAVVHVDNTARPQLINEKINKSYYNILKEYYKLTKIPTIVNTSFNMHEEPIVCSPEDAIRSFLQGDLDVLAIGNFIVKINNQ